MHACACPYRDVSPLNEKFGLTNFPDMMRNLNPNSACDDDDDDDDDGDEDAGDPPVRDAACRCR